MGIEETSAICISITDPSCFHKALPLHMKFSKRIHTDLLLFQEKSCFCGVCGGELLPAINLQSHRPRMPVNPCKRTVGPERSRKCKGPKGEENWRCSLLSEGRVHSNVEIPEAGGETEGVWK